MRILRSFSLLLFLLLPLASEACTAVIISGKVRPDGKPLMFKHRDTGNLDNTIEYFRGATEAGITQIKEPEPPMPAGAPGGMGMM